MRRRSFIASTLSAMAVGLFVLGAADVWAQAGPVGTSVQQYGGGVRWPDVAYDTHNRVYLVVWGPGTIRGIFVSEDGNAIGSAFPISDGTPWAQTPRAEFNPDTGVFLVAWQSSDGIDGNPSATIVRGRMVSYTSGVSALPTKAYSGTTYSTRWETGPALAYSTASGNFMVVWNRYSSSGAEVGARLLNAAGDPVGSEIVVTSTTDEYEREPTVGYLPGSDRFLVAWAASGSLSDSVRGKLYDASTGALNGTPLLFAQSKFTYVPEAAVNLTSGQVLVTWMQDDPATVLPGNGWRPFGRLVDGNGSFASSSPVRLSSIAGSYDANSVAFNALTQSFFLVTHGATTLQDVGLEISATGAPVSTAAPVTSVTALNLTGTFNPRINASTQQARWLVATAASFTSLWTQVVGGDGVAPPPDGGGTVNPRLTITPTPAGGTVTGGGLNCGTAGTTCQLTFTQSTSVALQAVPDEGFSFTGWGGACSGTNPSTTVQVDAIKYCSASFVRAWAGPLSEPPGCLATPTPQFSPQPGPIAASTNQYTGGTQNPDVAYNKCQQVYLTVWGLGGTIRGRFMSESGQGVGDAFAISSGQWAQTPKVIYNPNIGNFLVVWHSSASDTRTEVRAQLVTYPAGAPAAGTVLSAATYSSRWITRPAVGYSPNSGRYLVAWSRYAADGGADINARFIDTQAVPVASEFGVTSSVDEYDREPTIGHLPSTDRALLAWAGSGATSDFVRGKLYDVPTGTPYGTPITFAQTKFTYVPEATLNTNTGNLFVVWMQDDGGWRPFGNGINGNGQLVFTSAKRLSSTAGAYDANSIDYNPISKTFFLVTHGSNTLQDVGFEIGGDGTSLGTAAIVTSITWPNLTGAFNPRLAASTSQPQWLISVAASFQSLWTQLLGGTDTGAPAGTYALAVNPVPTGGTVTGGGLACGTGGVACSVTVASSTSVTLTATADTGYSFAGWGGACGGTASTTTVFMDAAKACSASFTPTGTTYQLNVSPAPANGTVTGGGINCGTGGAACQTAVASGTSVTLTATPAAGYAFTSWGGNCSGTSTTTTVLMNAAKTCSATFTQGLPTGPPYTMTISPKPTGGTITGAGLNCGTGGNQCAVTMPASMGLGMVATPDPGYTFAAWTGDCTSFSATITVQLAGPRTCSASFTPTGTTYQLNVSPAPTGGTVTGGGLNCGGGGVACQVTFGSATGVALTATPAAGYAFAGWGGSCTGTNTNTTVLVDGVRTCTAAFTATPTYQLNLSPVPTGGTVTGGGIACGTGGSACQATYGSSTSVTLIAAPDSGYTFTGWGGSCAGTSTSTTVLVNAVRTCAATFTTGPVNGPPYTMTISPKPTGGTVAGAGLNCGTAGNLCSVTMPASMGLGLQATPDSGYTFTGWTGYCTGTNPSLTVMLSGPRTCGATFTPVGGTTYQLTVSPAPTGGTVTGGGLTCGTSGTTCQVTFGSATPVTLTATPASTYTFTGWGGSCSGTSTTTTVQVDAVKTCSATFTTGPVNGPPYTMTVSPKPAGGTVTGAGLNCGVSGSQCSVTMPAAMSLGIQATPASGYTFAGWTGDCTGTNPSLTVMLSGPRTCGATFNPVGGTTYQLNISPVPTGGTVAGGGISCGTGGSTCQATYGASTSVTLTASPAAGFTFTGWGGSCTGTSTSTTVQVNGVKTCSATFATGPVNGPPYTMTISPRPTGGTVMGAGLNCGTGGSLCAVTMPAPMPMGLQATPAAGYAFAGWTGDCTGTNPSLYVNLAGPRTCGATFVPTGGGGH